MIGEFAEPERFLLCLLVIGLSASPLFLLVVDGRFSGLKLLAEVVGGGRLEL